MKRCIGVAVIMAAIATGASAQIPFARSAASADMIFTGDDVGSWFGARAHQIGDVDHDGVTDLLITARFQDGTGGVDCGRSRIFSGRTGQLIQSFDGEGPGDEIGHRTSDIGDVNGDGSADVLTSSYVNDANGTDAGRAYIFSGATGFPIHTWTGEAAGDNFGWEVVNVGDVTDDGVNDVVVAAPNHQGVGINSGKVYLYDGRTGDLLRTWDGEHAGDHLGFRNHNVGDVDGDGYDDLVTSAPSNDDGGIDAGKVYVISLRTGAVIHTWIGEQAGEHFGDTIEAAGDIDHDGRNDVLIASDLYSGSSGFQQGICCCYSGRTGAELWRKTGEHAGDWFGYRVQGGADINGDGTPDIMVTAIYNDAGGIDAGRVYAYSGVDFHQMYVWTGEEGGDHFGRVLQAPGDVNGDGGTDVIVGALHSNATAYDAGRAYLISGKTGRNLCIIDGEAQGDELGYSANDAGDLNHDGYADFTVTAIRNDAGALNAGRSYVFYGAPLFVSSTRLVSGQVGTILVTGARQGETVQLFANTAGKGPGPAVPGCGGLTLDIVEPIFALPNALADDNGDARLRGRVSNVIQTQSIFIQAVIKRGSSGSQSVKSQPAQIFLNQ